MSLKLSASVKRSLFSETVVKTLGISVTQPFASIRNFDPLSISVARHHFRRSVPGLLDSSLRGAIPPHTAGRCIPVKWLLSHGSLMKVVHGSHFFPH